MIQRYLQRVVGGLGTGLIKAEAGGVDALKGSAEGRIHYSIRRYDFTGDGIGDGMVRTRYLCLINGHLAKQSHSARPHVGELKSRVTRQLILDAGIEVLKVRSAVIAVHDAGGQGNAGFEHRKSP